MSYASAPAGANGPESLNAIHEFGRLQGSFFGEQVDQLEDLVLNTNPLPLLACFSAFFLTSLVKHPRIDDNVAVVQAHAELLQAIALRHRREEFVWRENPSSAVDPIGRCLAAATDAFSAKRMTKMVPPDYGEGVARQFIAEVVRGSTQLNRNWGYSYQTFRVIKELFEPLDSHLVDTCGATSTDILGLWTGITKLTEARLTAVIGNVGQGKTESTWQMFIRRVSHLYDIPSEHVERIRRIIKRSDQEVAEAAAFYLCVELILPCVYILKWDTLRQMCSSSVSDSALRLLMQRWAYSFGDLTSTNTEHYFLNNPIWHRPLIRLDADAWFIPLPHLFFAFAWDLFNDLIRSDPVGFDRYLRRRGKYLEEAIALEFQKEFPMATVLVGNQWTDVDTNTEYENDVLVCIDAFVFVIEAKAGMMHETARRGAPDRLKQVIDNLIAAPANQARRFERFLKRHKDIVRFRSKDGAFRELDLTNVRRIVSYSITLDSVGGLQAVQSELSRAGLLPNDFEPTPSLTLADLQNVFELLPGACPKLHYLVRRAELQSNTWFFAHELDLLAMYVDGQFNLGDTEFNGTRVIAYGCSATLENYFLEKELGGHPRSPKLKLSRWWENLLGAIDERRPKMWSLIGFDLLSVPVIDQRRFADLMREARAAVLKGVSATTGDRVLMLTGPRERRVAIAGVCYVDRTREERNARLLEAAQQLSGPDGQIPDRAVVLGCDPRLEGISYSVIVLVEFASGTVPDSNLEV